MAFTEPLPVLAIKIAGWLQTLAFIVVVCSTRHASRLRSSHASGSGAGMPGALLVYRLLMTGWGVFIGLRQLRDKGPYAFVFFTVWNWWLLTVFFALGSAASLRAWARRRSGNRQQQEGKQQKQRQQQGMARQQQQEQQQEGEGEDVPADMLDRAVMAMFAIEVPMALAIDFLTWTVLVPMLMSDPRPQYVAFWQSRLLCFESYNQHGFNAVMMLGDLLLNNIPVTLYDSGWLALWSSLFGVWSQLFHRRTGRFIYPFLDVTKPYAWASYLGIFGVIWAAYLLVMGLVRVKAWLLLPSRGGSGKAAVQGQPAGQPAQPGGSRMAHTLVDPHVLSDKIKVP